MLLLWSQWFWRSGLGLWRQSNGFHQSSCLLRPCGGHLRIPGCLIIATACDWTKIFLDYGLIVAPIHTHGIVRNIALMDAIEANQTYFQHVVQLLIEWNEEGQRKTQQPYTKLFKTVGPLFSILTTLSSSVLRRTCMAKYSLLCDQV